MTLHPALLLIQALTFGGADAALAVSASTQVESSWFEDRGASASGRMLTPVGLFPIWENTAEVLGHGHLYVGSNLVGYGIGDFLQIGTHPIRDVMRIPNVHAKVQLLDEKRLRVAAHAELLWMRLGASDAFTVSNFSSRLDTSKDAFWVAPVGVTASWAVAKRLFVHVTGTAQGVASSALPEPQVTFGAAAQLEWRPFNHHAFNLHATEVGLNAHDFAELAASYRYQRWIFEGSVGYAVRFYREGIVPFPIAALGVEL